MSFPLFSLGGFAVTLADVITVGGALMGAGAAIQQGQAAADAARYNAAVSRQRGQMEEERRRRESARRLSSIRAGVGKAGVTVAGTPLLVLAESAEMAELDALSARWEGEAGARLSEQRERSARRAIPYGVGASLLKGASDIASRR